MEQIYRIGIDHGYGNIKTAHHIFQSGVVQKGSITELSGMTVEYEGKFYEIGSTHKEYQMDKVWDDDYYVLTLAALAKELQGKGLYNASVILAAGLPIKWLEEQAGAFRKYLMQKKEVVFRYNGTHFHVKIEDVEVYAQGFAAIAENLRDYQGFNIVVDIGNGTMNVIFVVDGVPDSTRYYTERFGVDCCVIEMRSELTNKVHSVVKSSNAQDYVREAVEKEIYGIDKNYVENISDLCRYHDSQNPEHIYDITKAVIQSAQYMAAMRIQAEPPPASSLLPVLATAPKLMVYGLCNTALSVAGQVLSGIEKVFEMKKEKQRAAMGIEAEKEQGIERSDRNTEKGTAGHGIQSIRHQPHQNADTIKWQGNGSHKRTETAGYEQLSLSFDGGYAFCDCGRAL